MTRTKKICGVRGSVFYLDAAKRPVFFEDGVVAWDEGGTISMCGAWKAVEASLGTRDIADYRGQVILPGFVDCHVHLPQLDCRNCSGYGLLEWLERYIFPAEARFADPVVARETAIRFFQELLRHGTTTALIFSTIHEAATAIAFEEAERCGIRAILGKVLMDQESPADLTEPADRGLAATRRLIAAWHGRHDRLFYAVTPRFVLTCSRELLRGAGTLARETGCYLQTHIAETLPEVERTHALFGTRDTVGLFNTCGCLGPQSVFAHAIHLTVDEWRRFAASQSAIAHCPSSNIFLQSGRMPYATVRQHQIRCGLGSDVGAGPEFSLWDVMHAGASVHPREDFPPLEAFDTATRGGAQALSLSGTVGQLGPGFSADLAIHALDIRDRSPADWLLTLTTHWRTYPVTATYVAGRCCYAATAVA